MKKKQSIQKSVTLRRVKIIKLRRTNKPSFLYGDLVKIKNPKYKYYRFRVLRCYSKHVVLFRRGISKRSCFELHVKINKVFKVKPNAKKAN